MIPILIPLPAVLNERRAPELVGADQLRAAVEQRAVGDVRPDLRDARDVSRQPAELGAGEDDGEPVEDDLVAPGHPRRREWSW